jgi:hypothetical protein
MEGKKWKSEIGNAEIPIAESRGISVIGDRESVMGRSRRKAD